MDDSHWINCWKWELVEKDEGDFEARYQSWIRIAREEGGLKFSVDQKNDVSIPIEVLETLLDGEFCTSSERKTLVRAAHSLKEAVEGLSRAKKMLTAQNQRILELKAEIDKYQEIVESFGMTVVSGVGQGEFN